MPRFLAALAAVSLLSGTASADDKKVVIRWHGQSFFQIVTPAGARIVIDPHAIDNYGRKVVPADLVLMTHFHVDHSRLDAIPDAAKVRKINALKHTDRGDDFNVIDEKFKDVRVRSLGTYHDDMGGAQRGKNGVFILDVAGLRLVHLGDLGHQLSREQLRKLGEVDVLMIPVGGVYTINGVDAQKVVAQVKPRRYIIPMHYGTLVYNDLLDLKYFLEDQAMGTVEKFPGNELTVDAAAAVPKEPVIAILNWEGKKKDKD
jgi:L-ascorbate metabolism protein UlaG (beta-lactamase superfamily)